MYSEKTSSRSSSPVPSSSSLRNVKSRFICALRRTNGAIAIGTSSSYATAATRERPSLNISHHVDAHSQVYMGWNTPPAPWIARQAASSCRTSVSLRICGNVQLLHGTQREAQGRGAEPGLVSA